MKKMLVCMLALGLWLSGWAGPLAARADDDSPAITSFTTTMSQVDRAALGNRTARVPVSWTAVNRPVTANLVFDQVLPDGATINVELPRIIPWVASSGYGVAAPILPDEPVNEIKLRVRLVNMITGHVYDEKFVTVAIGSGSGDSGDPGGRPAITQFTTARATVRLEELEANSGRMPVTWQTINRPITANLVFEQVLPDGTFLNVELPREIAWVASSGQGVMAPRLPGGDSTQLNLRVRLVDLVDGRVYDQRALIVSIDDSPPPAPSIRYYYTVVPNVSAPALAARTARVPVYWFVDYRPDDSNLVFEQVLPDGSLVNVELPRTIAWVASSGEGVAAPVLPPGGANSIRLQVRLVDLGDNSTIDRREFTLPVVGHVPSDMPVIHSFTVTPNPVAPEGTVTLSWNVSNASRVSVTRLIEHGTVVQEVIGPTDPKQFAGSMTYTLPDEYVNRARFVLMAIGLSPDGRGASQEVAVAITCPFESSLVTGDCPVEQEEIPAAYQAFENGHMLWAANAIYVLYNGGTWQQYADTWQEGETFDVGETPPAGRVQPVRGFGKLWATEPNVRAQLGWALGEEQGYTAVRESHLAWIGNSPGTTAHFSLPDGRVVHLEATWRIE